MGKHWDKKSAHLSRKQNQRGEPKPLILIVCEGEKTEPNYFRQFRVTSITVHVEGTGRNTKSLVEEAIRLQEDRKRDEKYDQVWCVFDRDSFDQSQYNNAFVMAENKNFKLAYSNEAFELWYLLHFDYHVAGIDRVKYKKKLTKKLGKEYQKNSSEMYDLLLDKQETALKNAQTLLNYYKTNPTNKEPYNENPSTTVHLLVEELNKHM